MTNAVFLRRQAAAGERRTRRRREGTDRENAGRDGPTDHRDRRSTQRQALYMPALVATRFNQDLKAKYQALIAAGKPARVAIIAIMRKLIVLANTLLRANRTWTPKTA